MSGVDQSERFPWRRVAGAAYVPTAAFAIGEGAVDGVVAGVVDNASQRR